MEYKGWSTSVLKEKKYSSPQANSLLPPQHHCRRRRLMEALLSRPPHGDLSSPEEVGEPRSPEKRSGYQTSGPPCKGMIPRSDSPPSSSGTRTAAPTSSSQRALLHRHRTCVKAPPPKFALGYPGPCRARRRP